LNKEKALFLIDGVHKPDNILYSIEKLCRIYDIVASALVWIGGTEKIKDRESFSRIFKEELGLEVVYPLSRQGECEPEKGIAEVLSRSGNITTVVQLAGAPQINRERTIKYARLAVGHEARYIAGGTVFEEYRVKTKHLKPSIGLYATNKRVGKTAFGSYIGSLICGIKGYDTKWKPVVITHSRGGPPEPPLLEIYKKPVEKSVSDMTIEEIFSSRFEPSYLSRLLDFGLHGASDVFEDALILSAYLDEWERKNKKEPPYLSMIGCRRAGAGYYNEFVVSNADKGVEIANSSPADLIIHEGSGAEHPPVSVDGIIFMIPSDEDLDLIGDFPGLEKCLLYIIANCQKETSSPERVEEIKKVIKKRSGDVPVVLTKFVPEVINEEHGLEGRNAAFFTTAPSYILKSLSGYLEETYSCTVAGTYNDLDSDENMKKSIDRAANENKIDCFLFEIKARGVEGARYAEKKHGIPYLYINNIPLVVDADFQPAPNNKFLDDAVIGAVNRAEKIFSS